ncbi:hypothetical protein LZ30DRAFT_332439 [Colletotrichum cereale]|nr:hypothetical protein LZ30DRAFT_332439 [Colletotrichum cereale]
MAGQNPSHLSQSCLSQMKRSPSGSGSTLDLLSLVRKGILTPPRALQSVLMGHPSQHTELELHRVAADLRARRPLLLLSYGLIRSSRAFAIKLEEISSLSNYRSPIQQRCRPGSCVAATVSSEKTYLGGIGLHAYSSPHRYFVQIHVCHESQCHLVQSFSDRPWLCQGCDRSRTD